MRKTDLAYVAGIVDGEGSIGLYVNSKKSMALQVKVVNTNEWLIHWLKFAFGGSVYCEPDKGGNRKPLWRWTIVASQALGFLKLIYPYLRLKKPQVEIAIRFQEKRRGTGNRLTEGEKAIAEAQRILMANLNKRGVKEKGKI